MTEVVTGGLRVNNIFSATTLHGCVSCVPANIVKKALLNFSWLGRIIIL